MDLVVPASTSPPFINSWLASLPPVGIFNKFLFDVFNIYRVQEEQTLKDEDADRIEGIRRHQHAEEVRQQIREKEKERIKATNAFFEEGIKLDQEAKARYVCFLESDNDNVHKYKSEFAP